MKLMKDNWKCLNCKFFRDHTKAKWTSAGLKYGTIEYEYGICINKKFNNNTNSEGILNIDYGYDDEEFLMVGVDFGCIHFKEE